MNAASSRSHSIFALYLKGTNADRNEVSVRVIPNPKPNPNSLTLTLTLNLTLT